MYTVYVLHSMDSGFGLLLFRAAGFLFSKIENLAQRLLRNLELISETFFGAFGA
jgi:hypothetical protein